MLCTGVSDRQIRAISDSVRADVKEKLERIPFSTEGTPDSGWMLLDYGDVVVHIFSEDVRDYYDLEGLWSDVANVLLSIQ